MDNSYGAMPPNKESSGRSTKRRVSITQMEDEKDEDYIKRRIRNNQAVRKSRDKSKKKTEETLQRVNSLKIENCQLEEKIRVYRKQLSDLKEIFLAQAATGKLNMDIDFDALLNDSDPEAEEQSSSTNIHNS